MAGCPAAAANGASGAAPARCRLNRPLRILHVNDQPPGQGHGGAEVLLARLVDAQSAAGDEPLLLAGGVSHTGVRRVLDLWDPAARRLLRRRVRRDRPDVVHLHNVVRELSPSVIGACWDVPVVLHVHDLRMFSGGEHHLPDPRAVGDRLVLGPLVRREVRRHVGAVVAVSEVVKSTVRDAGVTAVHVVPVPVPPPVAQPLPVENCTDVVFAGTLAPDKGAHVLLAAFLSLGERHPQARLVLAGEGSESRRLLASASERVVLPGRLDAAAVSALLGRARVVVVPSLPRLRREGSSMTGAEAARHGRPLVTSDDPAVAEVAAAVGGDVVPAGDVQALAARIDHWLSSPEEAAVAGQRAAVAAAERYAVPAVAAQMRVVYESLLTR